MRVIPAFRGHVSWHRPAGRTPHRRSVRRDFWRVCGTGLAGRHGVLTPRRVGNPHDDETDSCAGWMAV